MYRRLYNTATYNPAPFRPNYGAGRRARYSSFGSGYVQYGPPRRATGRAERDRHFWRSIFPDLAIEETDKDKERRKKDEKERIPDVEIQKLESLTVKEVDLHIRINAKKHHTDKFSITKNDEPHAVLRRGQEFKATVTFNRAYVKDKDDLIFVFDADEESSRSGKKLKERFKLTEDGSAPYRKEGQWGATIVKEQADRQTLELSVYVPGDAVVGEWELKFDGGVLLTSLSILRKAFGFKISSAMGNPVTVARALSRIINSCDDNGVLVGNWSGDYSGGVGPTSWTSSVKILQQYQETGQPVKFGQCWVFSHVLTAVCRALGVPCRSVTNFDSAHDTDYTCTIDHYFSEDGDELKDMKSDSIWNFHVWNEVWILRPDYPDLDCDGWHVIDATPQEQSYGVFQCGPCPLKAVKRGEVNVGFDTAFVYGEVNADVVHWVVGPDGEIKTHSSIKKKHVGHKISTKPPDGKPHSKSVSWYNCDNPALRCDLTTDYKFPEGSEEERQAAQRATRLTRLGSKLHQHSADLEVWFDKDIHPMVGEAVVLTSHVKNISKDDRKVKAVFTVSTSPYWNRSRLDKQVAKEKLQDRLIKAGCEESFTISVPADIYLSCCDDSLNMYGYVCAKDLQTDIPYTADFPFRVRRPDLDVTEPMTARSGEVVTVRVSFTNSGSLPLTNCTFNMDGNLTVAQDDTNNFIGGSGDWRDYGSWSKVVGDMKEKETFDLTLRLVGQLAEDEAQASKSMSLLFTCHQIKAGVHGTFSLQLTQAEDGH